MAELGEPALLRSLRRYVVRRTNRLLVAPLEDDAAVWRGDPIVVATTDTMVEEIDFRLSWPGFDYRVLGRRLITINLSDLAAMGAEPRYALITLSLRGAMPARDVDRLYRGIAEQAHQFGCALAGGDLSGTLGPLTLTATVIGRLRSSTAMLKRRGARPGWQIAVTGTVGGAAAGLQLLQTGIEPKNTEERHWVNAQLDPAPQIAAGRLLVDAGVRVGGDISDGLYREVERCTNADGLGATIALEQLPLAPGLETADWSLAIRDSEDFQLICAAPSATIESAYSALRRRGLRLTVIGTIDEQPGIRLRMGERTLRLERPGYEHFR